MRRFPRHAWLAVWTLATLLAVPCPGAEGRRWLGPESVTAGPWLLVGRDEVRFCLRFAPPVNEAALTALPLTAGGRAVAVTPRLHPLPDPFGREAAQIQAEWSIPRPMPALPLVLGRPGDERRIDPPGPVTPGATVRVLLVSALAYPDREAVAALEQRLGGPATIAVWLGEGDARRLGTGGWEDRIPLVIAAPAESALGRASPSASPGLRLGDLLLAIADGDAGLAPALAEPAPWTVGIIARAPWDLALTPGSQDLGDAGNARGLLTIAGRRQVPLVAAAGRGTGFVSEPLAVDDHGHLRAMAGGTRYAVLPPGGEPATGLPGEVAVALDDPAIPALVVEDGNLRLLVGDLAWRWQRPPLEVDQAGPGWGLGDPVGLGQRLRALGSASAAATEPAVAGPVTGAGTTAGPEAEDPLATTGMDLIQLPRATLATAGWDVLDLFRLARPEGRPPTAWERHLARRLVADPWFVGDEPTLLARMPGWLQREAILRWMATAGSDPSIWSEPLARTTDPNLLRAWLWRVERAPTPALLGPGIRRLELQAAGDLPTDPEPLVQSRLAAAVFDSPLLSPTPLRAIAAGLEGRLTPLGYAPARRFLERHGRFRGADR